VNTDSYPRLLGDVGGTNARFAWQPAPGAPLRDMATLLCKEHDSLYHAMRGYLDARGPERPHVCGIGIANPILGDRVQMTNHHWSFSIAELQRDLGLERLVVINDFTALALSLPALAPEDLRPIGGGEAVPGAPRAVLGPGTGLGVSGLLPAPGGQFVALKGEGGHVTLAASDEREAAVIKMLHTRFGHASAERALSGPGLVNLYDAAAMLAHQPVLPLTPAQVIERARAASDPACQSAVELFCSLLGSVAGNLALTLGAQGGVYIGGGIVPRLLPEIERSRFRERFEAKGRFKSYLAAIPTWIIDAKVSPAFVGASRALDAHG